MGRRWSRRARATVLGGWAAIALVTAAAAVATPTAAAPAPAALSAGAWTVQDVPVPDGVSLGPASVARVSCAGPELCALVADQAQDGDAGVAVGDVFGATGLQSDVLPIPPAGREGISLGGISCPTTSACIGAGAGTILGLTVRWDGTSWSAASAWQDGSAPGPVSLNDVDCNASTCLAVGQYVEFDGRTLPWGAVGDVATGGWQPFQPSPPPSGTSPTAGTAERNAYQDLHLLSSPACPPSGSCVSLGLTHSTFGENYSSAYLMYRTGDGYASSYLPTPAGIPQQNVRAGALACPAARTCRALATYTNAAGTKQYLAAESVDRGRLRVRPIAIPSSLTTVPDPLQPRAISCPAITSCVGAVGFRNSTARRGAWLVRWDGTNWTLVAAPLPSDAAGPAAGDLTGVSCASRWACVAVGTYRDLGGRLRPLVETIRPSGITASVPDVGAGFPDGSDVTLQDVSCAGTACLAAGARVVPGSPSTRRPVVGVLEEGAAA